MQVDLCCGVRVTVLEAALTWEANGFCVVPAMADGSKMPRYEWKQFQGRRSSPRMIKSWYMAEPDLGVGLVCGKVSGDLEMTELEGRAVDGSNLDKVRDECERLGVGWLWDLLTLDGYAEWTPSGGIHLLYRIADHEVPGNIKIAMRPALPEELNDKERAVLAERSGKVFYRCLAETRGEGGFVIVAPSGGKVHPSGDSWSVAAGMIGKVPTIAWEDRCKLHEALRAVLDESPPPPVYAPPVRPLRSLDPGEVRPGDDFNARSDWMADILGPHGWSVHHQSGSETYVTRPGKERRDGWSACIGHNGSENLYVFSSSTEFEPETSYSKFAAFTMLEFNGDYTASTRELARRGFGTQRQYTPASDAHVLLSSLSVPAPEGSGPVEQGSSVAAAPGGVEAVEPRIREFTETGVAEMMFPRAKNKIRYMHEEQSWRVQVDGRWSIDKTCRISQVIKAGTSWTVTKAQEILAEAEASGDDAKIKAARKTVTFALSTRSDRGHKAVTSRLAEVDGMTASVDEFDVNKKLLCLDNGTFDLATMELLPHSPDHMLTKKISVKFDKDASSPRWQKYLDEVLPDREVQKYLQRAMGYALSGDTDRSAFFVLHGLTGCGKSQFIKVMSALFGEYAVTAAAKTFRASKYGEGGTSDLHDLRGSRFVSTSETSENTVIDEELIKRVTGDDEVTTRALYQKNITWKPEFVLFMATNFAPKMRTDDGAIWRRVKLIHFPNQFADTSSQVFGLAGQLIEAESAGIFNWLLEGYRQYRLHGLDEPESITEAVKEHRAELDPVKQFISDLGNDRIEVDDTAVTKSSDIYNAYVAWCQENHMPTLGDRRFGMALSNEGFEAVKLPGGVRCRKGLKTTPKPPGSWIIGQGGDGYRRQ